MKTPKGYRFSTQTLDQIDWLALRLGVTATDVLRIAVADLFERERARLPLVQLKADAEGYALFFQERQVLAVGRGAVAQLPEDFRQQLLDGSADVGDALVYLVLAAAKAGEQIAVNRPDLAEALAAPGED